MSVATYTKFQHFTEDLANKVHDLVGTAGAGADTLKVYLSNTAPNVGTHAVKADLPEIAIGNGYGGAVSVANVGTRAGGVLTVVGTAIVIAASGGPIGPFRFVILMNDTAPSDPLIGYWDYGAAGLTLEAGQFLPIRFNSESVSGTILTIT